jgi:RNA polymerase sigma-70 factor (ECF subfamily)
LRWFCRGEISSRSCGRPLEFGAVLSYFDIHDVRILRDGLLMAQKSAKHRAFEKEALPHSSLLYNYALRMTNNTADAEDLLQETFLKAYRFWDQYEQGTNIRAWLFRILKNSFINRYRKESKEPETVDFNDVQNYYTVLKGGAAEKEQNWFAGLLTDDVAKAIADLPDDFRTVVILCDIEGLTYEEIADFVSVPLGTVRSRLHRGRKLLREKLVAYASVRGYVAPA